MFKPVAVVALVLLASAPSISLGACPQNHFSIGAGSYSSLPVDSRSFTGSNSSSSASYNVPAGTLSLSFGCSGAGGECGSSGGVYVEDDFSVFGLPAGTPVSLTAHLSGFLNGGGLPPLYSSVTAHLQDTNGNDVTASTPLPNGSDYALTFPVQAIAGQTFRLHFELSGYSLGPVPGSGSGTFSFTGLPPGTAITSCQGFVSDPAVSAHASTWGGLRAIYR